MASELDKPVNYDAQKMDMQMSRFDHVQDMCILIPKPPKRAAPNVSREHRPSFPFSIFSSFRTSCQQFRTLFRSSFRWQPKIPHLIRNFWSTFSSFFLGFCAQLDFPSFRVFPPFLVFKGPDPEFRFSFFRFSALSGFQGSKSGIPVFFCFFRFLGLQTRTSGVGGSGHVGVATFGAHRLII